MIGFTSLKEYLPILTAFLGAFLAYIFNNRKNRFDRFYIEAAESLKEFYSPIFHEMRRIKSEDDIEVKTELLNKLIKSLVATDTNIYKAYNENLIELVYELDELLNKYMRNKDDEKLKSCFEHFDKIYYKVKKEYLDIQRSLYKQYPWHKKLIRTNYIVRLIFDSGLLFYDTVLFIGMCWLFLVYIIIVNRIQGKNDIPIVIKDNFRGISSIVIGLFMFAMICVLPYFFVVMDYRKQNKIFDAADKIIFGNIAKLFKKIFKLISGIRKSIIAIINTLK